MLLTPPTGWPATVLLSAAVPGRSGTCCDTPGWGTVLPAPTTTVDAPAKIAGEREGGCDETATGVAEGEGATDTEA